MWRYSVPPWTSTALKLKIACLAAEAAWKQLDGVDGFMRGATYHEFKIDEAAPWIRLHVKSPLYGLAFLTLLLSDVSGRVATQHLGEFGGRRR